MSLIFLLDPTLNSGPVDPTDVAERFERYRRYLVDVNERLGPGASRFAEAPWHYDPADHRCPHDSWVESVSIVEVSSGPRSEMRALSIEAMLLGAYHDGHLLLRYTGVNHYSTHANPPRDASTIAHGDLLIDEIRLSARGLVEHEVVFAHGRWLVECVDMTCEWRPLRPGAR